MKSLLCASASIAIEDDVDQHMRKPTLTYVYTQY